MPRRTLRELGLGFLYWLAFVLVLEPGNLANWAPQDPSAWAQETGRLLGAGLLGAAATPFILALTRRWPVEGSSAWRHAGLHLGASCAMAAVLIVTSCLLSAWLWPHEHRPLSEAISLELQANLLLVWTSVAILAAAAHMVRFQRQVSVGPATEVFRRTVAITTRGRTARIALTDVHWIETQGNYLALHGVERTRLVRQTSARLEAELDPGRFVRIHRRIIIAIGAIEEVSPRAAGDATVRLTSGVELPVSRNYRPRLRAALSA
jgi:hypothetical protein